MDSHCFQSRGPVGEKIDWAGPEFRYVSQSWTSFATDLAIILGEEMRDQSMIYHQLIGSTLYKQKIR